MPQAGRVGDASEAPKDHHGCPECDHSVRGPAVKGSPNVKINSRSALRVDDTGTHSHCCGANTWKATKGAPGVFINGKPAHRRGDATRHCGGDGELVEGSRDVRVGDYHTGPGEVHAHEGGFTLEDEEGKVLADTPYVIRLKDGREIFGRTDKDGHTALVSTKEPEELEVEILNDDPCGT